MMTPAIDKTNSNYEHLPKDARANFTLPTHLLKAVREKAAEVGMPYQRFIRTVLEQAVSEKK